MFTWIQLTAVVALFRGRHHEPLYGSSITNFFPNIVGMNYGRSQHQLSLSVEDLYH